jgi:hypothetical protein
MTLLDRVIGERIGVGLDLAIGLETHNPEETLFGRRRGQDDVVKTTLFHFDEFTGDLGTLALGAEDMDGLIA